MASKQWYEHIAGNTAMNLLQDPLAFDKTVDTARLSVIVELQALSTTARQEIADINGQSLAEFDDDLEKEGWELNARLLFYDFPTRGLNLTVKDGDWFSPEAVESFCGETGANVAANSIDENDATFWRHVADEEHSITYRLRDFPLKISKIRFRYNNTEPANEQLDTLTVRASRALGKIDDAGSLLESNLNITWPAGQGSVWVEHTLVLKKASARYVKLEGFGSAQASNTIQIREFAVFVETKDPKETEPEE